MEIPVIIVYEVIPDFPLALKEILNQWGIKAEIKQIGDVPSHNMSKHRLLIAMDDANNWSDDAVITILNSRIPVLAFGNGGTKLLEMLDTGISYGNSMVASDNRLQVLDEGDPILEKPFTIELPPSMQINMFEKRL